MRCLMANWRVCELFGEWLWRRAFKVLQWPRAKWELHSMKRDFYPHDNTIFKLLCRVELVRSIGCLKLNSKSTIKTAIVNPTVRNEGVSDSPLSLNGKYISESATYIHTQTSGSKKLQKPRRSREADEERSASSTHLFDSTIFPARMHVLEAWVLPM